LLHPNQRFREPFGLAPVEAMLCGCPVIAWKYGAMTETVVPGETGLLCESMDVLVNHIKTLANVLKPEERPRCRNWAMKFSIENMVDGYEALCYEALKNPW
jgi:glycosyltransferase involved in cell wall biosynthesis